MGEALYNRFARIPLQRPIVHGNALTLDWDEVLPAARYSLCWGIRLSQKERARLRPKSGLRACDGSHQWLWSAGFCICLVREGSTLSAWGRGVAYRPGLIRCLRPQNRLTCTRHTHRAAFCVYQQRTQGSKWACSGVGFWRRACTSSLHRTFRWNNEASVRNGGASSWALTEIHLPGKVTAYTRTSRVSPHGCQPQYINPLLGTTRPIAKTNETLCESPLSWEASFPRQRYFGLTLEAMDEFLPRNQPQREPHAHRNDYIINQTKLLSWLSSATAGDPEQCRIMAKIAEVKRFREGSRSSQKFAATPWLFRETDS